MSNPSGATSVPFTLSLSHTDPVPLVYVGKLDWFNYAVNEMITIVVPSPGSYNTGDTVCVYWQWTVDATGAKKKNRDFVGPMEVLSTAGDGSETLRIPVEYYTFDGVVSAGKETLTMTMSNPNGEKSKPVTFSLVNAASKK